MIYAFFGIGDHTYGIAADYSAHVSFTEVSCRLARNIILHHGSLNIFNRAHFTPHEPSRPSWVPDWRLDNRYPPPETPPEHGSDTHISFLPNAKGQQDCVLQIRGVPVPGGYYYVRKGVSKLWDSEIEEADEVWRLVSLPSRFVLRKQGVNYRIVGRTEAPNANMEQDSDHNLELMVRHNHPWVRTINIY